MKISDRDSMDQKGKCRPRRNERRPRGVGARNPSPLLQRLKLTFSNIGGDLNRQSVAGHVGDTRVSLAALKVSSSVVDFDKVGEGAEGERAGADGCKVIQGSNYLKNQNTED